MRPLLLARLKSNICLPPLIPGSLSSVRALCSQAKQSSTQPAILQVWGANTDVGKTIFSAGLLRAAKAPCLYIKPVQTGFPQQDDGQTVVTHAKNAQKVTLFTYPDPVSPDLAARNCEGGSEGHPFASDAELCARTQLTLNHYTLMADPTHAKTERFGSGLALLETAGGVLSPAPSGTPQADVYRPLRLQAMLLGDASLGGISTTVSAYESLRIRGYDVPAIVFLPRHEDGALENEVSVDAQVDTASTTVFRAPCLPKTERPLADYFLDPEVNAFFDSLLTHVRVTEEERRASLSKLESTAKDIFWYPFTQHTKVDSVLTIDSAHGDNYELYDEHGGVRSSYDASGSWWTNGVGHGNPRVASAMASAAGRYGHVLFPEAVHEPAALLAKRLVSGPGKNWASRVFYSDDGSTAVEVALKMAFRKRAVDVPERSKLPYIIVGFEDSYHGDTLGVMNCSTGSDFNSLQTPWYEPRGLFFKPPTVGLQNGTWKVKRPSWATEDEDKSFTSRDDVFSIDRQEPEYRTYIAGQLDDLLKSETVELGALVMEPVLQGAGGMIMIDPAFQRILVEECRSRKIPVIFDEIFSGLWRLGVESASELLHCKPDIATYSKLLTGGTVPLSATLATEEVKKAFDGESKREALLHGHSYTAHPIGCAAAVESLRIYEESLKPERQYWDENFAKEISSFRNVEKVTVIGTVFAVKLVSEGSGYSATGAQAMAKKLRQKGIYARPLGNVIYMLATPLTEQHVCIEKMKDLSAVLEAEAGASQETLSE